MHATTALSAISAARACLREERTAFSTFARQVADLEPAPGPASGGGDGAAGVVAMRATPVDGALRRVRNCYRDTVLDARDDTTDRSLTEQLTTDFGRETAMAVTNGTTLSVPLQDSLVHGARRATIRRESAIADLDREETTLKQIRALASDADDPITMAQQSLLAHDFDDLLDLYDTLNDLESRIDSLLEARQDVLHPINGDQGGGPTAIRTGVYRSLPVSHPVLADGTALIRDLRSARERVSAAIARRD